MAASKRNKKPVISKDIADDKQVILSENPNAYYKANPSWRFHRRDTEKWSCTKDDIWDEIIPKLSDLENRTWADILQKAKKQNHSIECNGLNDTAKKRLVDLKIEYESIISLHLTGTHRIYGYIVGTAFNILWYDKDHGDNDLCVCRSNKKHT